MKISYEFSKHADEYDTYSIIQQKVIDKLLALTLHRPKRILDLGCGNGRLFKSIEWDFEQFVGVDFAAGMLALHPKPENTVTLYGDFNDPALFQELKAYDFDHIFSASALQWAKNLDEVFKNLAALHKPLSLAIFTAGTFKELNARAGVEPLLRAKEEIESIQKKYLNATTELVQYKLEFTSTREMFRYIKKSGVSGARNILTYKETKKLMKEYPLNYLEFEVVFITTT